MNDTPKSVLYLSPYFWPEDIGSAPYCTDLAAALVEQGHSVTTIAFRPHYPNPQPFMAWANGARDADVYLGIRIRRVAVSDRSAGGFKARLKNDVRYLLSNVWWSLRRKNDKADVVVAYVPTILTLYAAAVHRLIHKSRIVAVVHDIESGLATSLGIASGSLMPRILRTVERVGLNLADELIVLTDGMKDELVALGCTRPITVIPIWAKVAPFCPPVNDRGPTVAYSGNFGKKQNLDQILPLIERLWHQRPDVSVLLRGDGSEKERLQNEIKSRGIGNTYFLPLAPSEEFVDSLQSVNLHLVPQASNVANYALPSKLFSVMSVGRPYVCIAPAESPLDVLATASGAGICVRPGDQEALWNSVNQILDSLALQQAMGEAGRQFVEKNMSRSIVHQHYLSIFFAQKTQNL